MDTTSAVPEKRRSTDGGIWCVLAQRFRDVWDWVDKRDIDKHLASWFIFVATWDITHWALNFVSTHPEKSGTEAAAVIAAVMFPWSGLQAAALKWYFDSRAS